jgi:hypothetical protein
MSWACFRPARCSENVNQPRARLAVRGPQAPGRREEYRHNERRPELDAQATEGRIQMQSQIVRMWLDQPRMYAISSALDDLAIASRQGEYFISMARAHAVLLVDSKAELR